MRASRRYCCGGDRRRWGQQSRQALGASSDLQQSGRLNVAIDDCIGHAGSKSRNRAEPWQPAACRPLAAQLLGSSENGLQQYRGHERHRPGGPATDDLVGLLCLLQTPSPGNAFLIQVSSARRNSRDPRPCAGVSRRQRAAGALPNPSACLKQTSLHALPPYQAGAAPERRGTGLLGTAAAAPAASRCPRRAAASATAAGGSAAFTGLKAAGKGL